MRRAPRPCLDCHTLGTWPRGRCPGCTRANYRARDRTRTGRRTRGNYDTEYQKNRAALLEGHPHCHWCGNPATQADHLTPLAQGGGHEPDNLVPSCARCNAQRGGQQRRQRR